MAKEYNGHHPYTEGGITFNAPSSTGVYYCGVIISNDVLKPYYVGKSASENGIYGRLMDHLREDRWYDVTHFGFIECSNEREALDLEANEIKRFQPKYNTQGK